MMSTFVMPYSLFNNSAVPIPWMVLPSPMSSASRHRPAFAANLIPSSWKE